MSRPLTLTALLLVSAAWLTALAVTPVAGARWERGGAQFAAAMYVAGSLICHQRPERSFHLDGAQLPVCARCSGLYAGVSLGVLGWMGLVTARGLWRFNRFALILSAVVGGIITPSPDVLSQLLMAGPLYGLFTISIVIVWMIERARKKQLEALEKETGAELVPSPPE